MIILIILFLIFIGLATYARDKQKHDYCLLMAGFILIMIAGRIEWLTKF